MSTRLGRFPAEYERPEPLKFAWPIVLVPELFTTADHLAVLRGYLASLGWEVYTPDLRAAFDCAPARRGGFEGLAARLEQALSALGRDVVLVGHGLGGLLALKAAELAPVRAAVAIAPMLPGVRSRLVMRAANWRALWLGRALAPPRGAALFHLMADAEPFQRQALVRALVADDARAAMDVVRGRVRLEPTPRGVPRLIVTGDSDPFVPLEHATRLAERIGAATAVVPGRGHWLVGGRGLERTMAAAQRFLVRNLGADLLLLYPEEFGSED
ncbi:MAG TPA: alpha/beta fold hydrolase [Candidatus Binataceae bacterium]|jgi:pimeloyl-ACP methyl ester carboxylesterase|nr:alpha/beta fold hydrolase [Candidatus Binataceae bacterium]